MRRYTNQENNAASHRRNGRAATPEPTDISTDLSVVREDLVKLGEDAAATAQHGAEAAKEYARMAGEQTRQGMEQVVKFVQDRPATSVLIGGGIGAICARLLIPRS